MRVIVGLMLTGRADRAKRLLDRTWPRRSDDSESVAASEARLWSAVCRAVVAQPLWQTFGLARLPHADLIRRGAALTERAER